MDNENEQTIQENLSVEEPKENVEQVETSVENIEEKEERHEVPVEEDGQVLTMVDVLEEEQKLEEDANAVLGASDEKNCTYSKVIISIKKKTKKTKVRLCI